MFYSMIQHEPTFIRFQGWSASADFSSQVFSMPEINKWLLSDQFSKSSENFNQIDGYLTLYLSPVYCLGRCRSTYFPFTFSGKSIASLSSRADSVILPNRLKCLKSLVTANPEFPRFSLIKRAHDYHTADAIPHHAETSNTVPEDKDGRHR